MFVLGNIFKSEEVWNITEWSGSVGLQRPLCRKRNQNSARRDSNCGKINSETERGSAAKNYQGLWTSKSRRVERLCSLWPFHSILFQLGETILNSISWKYFFIWRKNMNSMCGYAQSDCENQKESYANYIRKNKACFLQNLNWKSGFEVQKVWLVQIWPIFQWKPTELCFVFKIFSHLIFQFMNYIPLAVKFLRRPFLLNKMCWLSHWSMMQSLKFCRKVGKIEKNQNSMYSR